MCPRRGGGWQDRRSPPPLENQDQLFFATFLPYEGYFATFSPYVGLFCFFSFSLWGFFFLHMVTF